MTIKDLGELELRDILNARLTPSKEIESPDRLVGREEHLRKIARAFNSEGRNVFVFGDRGIGKTSVARTAATLNNSADSAHIYVVCGANTSFGQVLQAVGNAVVPVAKRMKPKKVAGGGSVGVMGANLGFNFSSDGKHAIDQPSNVIEAMDILSYVAGTRKGQTIVVIDEFDRITNDTDKTAFAELIKNLSTRNLDLRFVFCGIGHTVDELLGKHQSVGRYFQPIELQKLHHNYLWSIIEGVAAETKVQIPQDILIRIGIVSDGFPHFVHLIGQCMFYAMHDCVDEITHCQRRHYDAGIKEALNQTEPSLRAAYRKATEKTKNQLEYEEALWALADRAETRRQVTNIYEVSYKRIMHQRSLGQRSILTKEKFNQRLLSLKKSGHGGIVVGGGSGWFAFRENVMRGFVRVKAESEGVTLMPDVS